jgi:hypothetical protein
MTIAYEAATNTVAAANAAAYIEFVGNGTRRAKIREWGTFSQAATAVPKCQIGRPAASGITPGTLTLGKAQDPADAVATAQWSASWGTPPTAPTVALRQFDFNNVIGSGVIFTWPSDGELVCPATGIITLVQWNGGGTTGPICSVYAVWSE